MIGLQAYWSIGSSVVNGQLATVLLALFILFLLAPLAERSGRLPSTLRDEELPWLMEALILFILGWKLSPLLTQPSLLWKNPLGLLMMQSSSSGLLIGLGTASIYLVWRTRLRSEKIARFSDGLALYLLVLFWLQGLFFPAYGVASQLPWAVSVNDPALTYHPLHLYLFIITTVLGGWILLKGRVKPQAGQLAWPLLLTLGVSIWLLAWLQPVHTIRWGLQAEQWIALALLGFAFYLRRTIERQQD